MTNAKPLLDFRPGDTVRVVKIDAGRGLRQRLLALGLVPGADVYLISNGHGPVRLCFHESRIAIGRGVAAKVYATPAPVETCPACAETETCPDK